jgi:hypothetical protein
MGGNNKPYKNPQHRKIRGKERPDASQRFFEAGRYESESWRQEKRRGGGGKPFYPKDGAFRNRGDRKGAAKYDKSKGSFIERAKWTPVKMSTEEIPVLICPICGKIIKDPSCAFSPKEGEGAVHFECALETVKNSIVLYPGDVVAYIGGGRFGVINYAKSQSYHGLKVKQIIEWEKKENRARWRGVIADHFSLT